MYPHWNRYFLLSWISFPALSATAYTIIYTFNDNFVHYYGDNEFTTCDQGINFTIIEGSLIGKLKSLLKTQFYAGWETMPCRS